MSTPSSRWPWPYDRWERAILAGTAIAVVVAAAAVLGTLRARRVVRDAAIASLGNYAAVGMEQFVNGYEGILRESFLPILPPPDDVEPSGRRDPLPVEEMLGMIARLAADPCRCRIDPAPSALFRIGLDAGSLSAIDRLGHPLSALDARITDAVRGQADSLVRLGWRYGFLVTATDAGPQFIFFSHRVDAATGHRYAYGFVVPAARMAERVFAPAFGSVRLVPRHLLATVPRNGDFLSLDLATRDAPALFATVPAYPDGPADALNLPPLRGGLMLRAHLNPGLKDALIPGGIPPRVPGRELGLLGLSLGLLLAIAALGLRVGDLARLRADLASSVTHELRTPLTQIRLAAETILLGRSRNPEGERRSLASIVDETRRLQQLIDNVLHFSRAERRLPPQVRLQPVALRPLVERAVADQAPLVADRGIQLRVQVPDGLTVRGDAHALRQVVLNLLDNAARYGPDHQTVTVGASLRDGAVVLRVEDRGPGIPPGDRDRVWRAFVRLPRDREAVVTGSGLGLAVVRELVEAQGGRCWIESNAAQGATVVVRLAAGEAAA